MFVLFFLPWVNSAEPLREMLVVSRETASETLAAEENKMDEECGMIDLNAFVKLYRIGMYCLQWWNKHSTEVKLATSQHKHYAALVLILFLHSRPVFGVQTAGEDKFSNTS